MHEETNSSVDPALRDEIGEACCLLSESDPPQPQRVADDADRRQRHGRSTEGRRQQQPKQRVERPPRLARLVRYRNANSRFCRMCARRGGQLPGARDAGRSPDQPHPGTSMQCRPLPMAMPISAAASAGASRRRPSRRRAFAAQPITAPCAPKDIRLDTDTELATARGSAAVAVR